jgi:predicted outer membrane protein
MAHVNPIQIQKYLKGVDYPASKKALLDKAKSMGADDNVCASLAQLPDEDYQTPADVSQAFGALPDAAQPARVQRDKTAQAAQAAPRSSGSNEFLMQALQDSMAEIQICELALEKLDNADAKAFAQSMIDEHGRMGIELERLAAARNLDIPSRLRPEQEMTVDELSRLEGNNFGQRWIQYNIDTHERDIKIFQHYAGVDDDPEIRKLARSTAATFGKHLKIAHDVGRNLAKT